VPNGAHTSHIWNLRESATARADLDHYAANDNQFTRLWNGVAWLIIHDPVNIGNHVASNPDTYYIKTRDFLAIGMPIILVVYQLVNPKARVLEIMTVFPAP